MHTLQGTYTTERRCSTFILLKMFSVSSGNSHDVVPVFMAQDSLGIRSLDPHEAVRKLMNTFRVDGLTRALTRQL